MIHSLIIIYFLSTAYSSDLNNWIHEKSLLIKENKYKIQFNYSLNKKQSVHFESKVDTITYYSVDLDSSVLVLEDRIILSNQNVINIVNHSSSQIFIEEKDQGLEDLKDKILAIFLDDNYKIIRFSDKKYLLSMNDYFLNMDIDYEKRTNLDPIIAVSFFQNPYSIHIKDLTITAYDSIPYPNHIWENYKIFNLME